MGVKVIYEMLMNALRSKGEAHLKVSGRSMVPNLQVGDIIKIVAAKFEDLYPSQIIAFRTDENITIHRIVYISPIGVITAGDNNILSDEPVKRSDFIGLVTHKKLPNGIYVSLENNVRESKTHNTPKVYLADKLYHLVEPGQWGMKLYPISQLKNPSPLDSVGISPQGLHSPSHLLKVLNEMSNVRLICFANFGPEQMGEGYLPINKVRYVVRLEFFDYWEYWLSEMSMMTHMFLSYLGAFISASNHLKVIK